MERPDRFSTARFVTLAALLLLALAMVGCGDDDDSSDGNGQDGSSQEAFPPHVVRDSEIEAQEEGSPERALLEWWQAFQFSDSAAVLKATSPATLAAVGPRNLAQLVKKRGQGLQGVEVLGAGGASGNTASVRAGLLTFRPEKPGDPPPTTPTASRPTTFAMRKGGGGWLFAETAYLQPMVANMQQAEKQQQQQQTETTEEPPAE